MPRSRDDGRWIRECKLCGEPFFQRKPKQEFCSQKCSNKAFPGVGGRKPDRTLGKRICPVCSTEFQPYRDKQTCCTNACYRTTREYAESQVRTDRRPERQARKNQLRRVEGDRVEKVREYNRLHNLRYKYGLTVADYEQMLAEQRGVCILCGKPPKPDGVRAASRLHVDHDHETGAVRQLLCLNCNRGLGYLKDDPGLLRAAAEYIERHRALT